jgi:hypothetical protein
VPVMNRRTFFSSGILGAVAMGASPIHALRAKEDISSPVHPKILNYNPAMKYRPMGNTEMVSERCEALLFICC